MITLDELRELNQSMLDGISDGTGYRASDYPDVAVLSRLKVPYNWIEELALLDTLLNYSGNPKLIEHITDISSRYDELYKKLCNITSQPERISSILSDARLGRLKHTYNDFFPFYLRFLGHDEQFVYLGLREYVGNIKPSDYGGFWKKINGKSSIAVHYNSIYKFLEFIRTAGIVGHIAPDSLLKFISDLEKQNKIKEDDQSREDIRMYPLKDKNEFGHVAYVLTTRNQDLIDEFWKNKNIAIKYVDTKKFNDRIVVFTTREMILPFMNICTKYNARVVEAPDDKYESSNAANASAVQDVSVNVNNINKTISLDIASLSLPITPYPFQVQDAEWLLTKKRGLLGHDMGCGKTIIAILVGMHLPMPKIVVCPESLRLNWKREIERMQPNADIRILYSKDKDVARANDWTILGYQTCTKYKDLLKAGTYTLFVDESHNIKSVNNYGQPSSARASAVMSLAEHAERLYLMTGTPMPTRSKDLYNMLVMLHEINAKESYAFHRYGLEFCHAFQNEYGWNYNGTSNREKLHAILSKHMIRRLKKDVLPNLHKQRQFIPISEINPEYRAVEKDIIKVEPGLAYMGLAMKGRRLLSRVKIKPAIDLAENYINSEESIVIVTEFKETLERIAAHFGNNACTICGDMTDKAKQKAIDEFQSGEKKVCIINMIAGGVGVTLTKAHNMIICDYDWTPSNMIQVEDRICRSGQTECCNIYYLYCEEALLDRAFISMITHKSENVDKVVDNSENTNDFEKSKNDNKLYYEYLVAQIKKERRGKLNQKDEEEILDLEIR